MSSDKHQDTSPLTALISKFHAGNREVGIEARFRASLNGEVPVDADARGEDTSIDRIAVESGS